MEEGAVSSGLSKAGRNGSLCFAAWLYRSLWFDKFTNLPKRQDYIHSFILLLADNLSFYPQNCVKRAGRDIDADGFVEYAHPYPVGENHLYLAALFRPDRFPGPFHLRASARHNHLLNEQRLVRVVLVLEHAALRSVFLGDLAEVVGLVLERQRFYLHHALALLRCLCNDLRRQRHSRQHHHRASHNIFKNMCSPHFIVFFVNQHHSFSGFPFFSILSLPFGFKEQKVAHHSMQ